MAFSVIKRKRTRQPQAPVKLSSKWLCAIAPGLRSDVDSSGASIIVTAHDRCFKANNSYASGSGGPYPTISISNFSTGIIAANKKWTLLAAVDLTRLNPNEGIMAQRNTTGWTFCVFSNNLTFYTGSAFVSGTVPAMQSGFHIVSIASHGDDSGAIYLDGVKYPISGLNGITGTTSTLEMLSWDSGGYVSAGNKIYLAAISDSEIDEAELKYLTGINPWQIFVPKKLTSYFDLVSAADLAAVAQATATATGAINQAVAMSGASVVIASATGAVNQSVGLSGAAASVSVADGAVNVTTTLSGDGFVESFASGALASALALEASAQAAATAAADLSTGADLAGTAASQATSAGSIGLSVLLSADSLIQALAAANLDGGAANDLSGNAAIIATATGGIMQDVPVLGSATVTVTGAGGLSSTLQLEGAAAVSALAGGDLQVSALGLSANAIIQALAGGSIEMTLSLSADALAQALSVGTLTVGDLWSGAFIEKYTALAAERKYTTVAPERNYIYAS